MQFDTNLRASDPADIRRLVEETGMFRECEVRTAGELVEETLQDSTAYRFLFCRDERGIPVAYSCFGEIPLTEGSYDLYWIVVAKELQGQGQGKLQMQETEKIIRGLGGRQIYAETSGTPEYEATRKFYLRQGYLQVAVFKEFYRPGDDKVVYCKMLT